jgi:hypothetical protein
MSANLQREDPISLRPYKWILNDLQVSTLKLGRVTEMHTLDIFGRK